MQITILTNIKDNYQFLITMSSNIDRSGSHSPPQPSLAQEGIEETLRTLQETLRHLQSNRSTDWKTLRLEACRLLLVPPNAPLMATKVTIDDRLNAV